ncbi:MAG: hypothetical protein GXY83_34525 [Rhodopirellula sp.]|nr:hypothetical protein [Rhodopirellula sp.]
MSHDAEKRAGETLHKLRKLKGFCPMTPEEADAAYDAAPADPICDDEVESLIDFVTSGGKASWEPKPDLGWTEDEDLSNVDEGALQLHRNKGEDEGDSTEEDKLREEMLADDEEKDEDGVDGGEEPPADGW